MDTQDTNISQNEEKLEENKSVPTAETLNSDSEVTSTTTDTQAEVPVAEEVATPNIPDAAETENQTEDAINLAPQNKEEVLNRMKEIAENTEHLDKQEVDALKQAFYKFHHNEQEEAKLKFIENGGKEEDFHPEQDPLEPEFKDAMAKIKVQRNVR